MNKITNFGNKNIELSILGTSINSKGYKFLSIKLVPLLSVTKIVSKLFFKWSKIIKEGITCPPDPPVEINIFFTNYLPFF